MRVVTQRWALSTYDGSKLDRGRSLPTEIAWIVTSRLVFERTFAPMWLRRAILRLFGADVGDGTVIKPHVLIKFPWKLRIDRHAWIGEYVWIDNLAQVSIGSDSSVSQGVYLCTGNHDYRSTRFDLRAEPITIGRNCWIGAFSLVGPGVNLAEGTVVSMGERVTATSTPVILREEAGTEP